ncbi:MAG: DUF2254 domain-containing protein [Armatimonadota bacterium]
MRRLQLALYAIFKSFWLLPSALVAVAIVFAFILLRIDSRFEWEVERSFLGLFSGQADAARQLLAAIAGSLITVISISFSITILALQQVATQYSPRVLRNFTADRANQVVLGSYLGTFIYSLLVLRAIRSGEEGGESFVPALSITAAFVFSVFCIGLLIFFISHIAGTLQVGNIVRRIHTELMDQLDDLFPEQIGDAAENVETGAEAFRKLSNGQETSAIRSDATGYIQAYDEAVFKNFDDPAAYAVLVHPQVGEFVVEGEIIITVQGSRPPSDEQRHLLLKAVVVGPQRSIYQDPLFAVEQLTDIALRALSTGINDPATASSVLYQLTHALCWLSSRKFPDVRRVFPDNHIIFIFSAPGWEQHLEISYTPIRYAGRNQGGLLAVLIKQLGRLAAFCPTAFRRNEVIQQLMAVKQQITDTAMPDLDRKKLLDLIQLQISNASPDVSY